MLLVSENTKLYRGIRYLEPAIGRADYWTWTQGAIPSGAGAFAFNGPVPDISAVINGGIFCAGVSNLILRRAGKRVPFRPSLGPGGDWDGSISAMWSSPWGPGYFTGWDKPFNLEVAKRWARETRSGVLLGREYSGSAIHNQGHAAILLPSGFVLQSDARGLNWASTIEQDHAGWYYTRMVHPEYWLEYSGDEF